MRGLCVGVRGRVVSGRRRARSSPGTASINRARGGGVQSLRALVLGHPEPAREQGARHAARLVPGLCEGRECRGCTSAALPGASRAVAAGGERRIPVPGRGSSCGRVAPGANTDAVSRSLLNERYSITSSLMTMFASQVDCARRAPAPSSPASAALAAAASVVARLRSTSARSFALISLVTPRSSSASRTASFRSPTESPL